MNYQKYNNITGWFVFLVALIVYTATVEETASFWDCGEFIAVSYKLEVPHPPGAPLFLLIGRLFSFLAAGEETVAFWINMVSVVTSAFAILFLFWTITMLAKKALHVKAGEASPYQTLQIMGAGVIGALACTFSDSFWFSATEAEVYGMSAFFTAFVFWAILKWEGKEDPAESKKWLILIAYMMGLSIGVHLLNLVTIPALGLIYYFKKHQKASGWGIAGVLIISGFLILLINYGIIPGLPSLAGSFEIFFVNTLGLPFGAGIIFFTLALIIALVAGIIFTQRKSQEIMNTALLALAFILIGYSSYAVIVIRSNFDPPIDENNPENIISFVSYLKREQYGDRPLLYGQYFTAQAINQERGAPIYIKGEDKYVISDYRTKYEYEGDKMTLLPRAYSSSPNHVEVYRQVMNLKPGEEPTFADNIEFMFKRQIGHMYMRYFMWNFAGRESDIQDAGWLSPFDAFKKVPELLERNKGRNNFFMIPLLLGMVGLFFQYAKDPKSFSAVIILFFLTGIGLVLYLNSPPVEPRERDYIYAGSFYVFAIWIGFAVLALSNLFERIIKNKAAAATLAFVVALAAPGIMAAEGWDDHDRSNRFFSVDSAKNFLASCAPNAILFTGGDNDTFPLWYAQEVEGFRTDVRVIVLSYFNTDWYISQMTKQVNKSEPIPMSLTFEHFRQGGLNDVIIHNPNPNVRGAINLEQYMELIRRNYEGLQVRRGHSTYNTIPTKSMYLNVDTARIKSMDILPEKLESLATNRMVFTMKSDNYMEKNTLMMLDILAANNWERPIYLNNTSLQGIGVDFTRYVVQEGNAYRLLPVENPRNAELVNTDVMYENLMQNFFYRELDNPGSYYNEDYRQFVLNHRSSFNTLADALLLEQDTARAREVVLKSLETIPDEAVPYDFTSSKTVDLLYRVGENERALEIGKTVGERAMEMLAYYDKTKWMDQYDYVSNLRLLQVLSSSLQNFGEQDLAQRYKEAFENHSLRYRYMR